MDAKTAIRESLATAEMVSMSYLKDLDDSQLMLRPHSGCQHINWQVGHLISSEHQMMSQVTDMPALPEGFAEKYSKETIGSDNADEFANQEILMATYRAQRDATLAFLEEVSSEKLDDATGVDYAPTTASLLSMQGMHWMMHCGQWVIVRRMCDKPIVI